MVYFIFLKMSSSMNISFIMSTYFIITILLNPILFHPFLPSFYPSLNIPHLIQQIQLSHHPLIHLYLPLHFIPSLTLKSHSSPNISHNSPSSSTTSVFTNSYNIPQLFIVPPNTHYMITRSKDNIVFPTLHPTLLITHAEPRRIR